MTLKKSGSNPLFMDNEHIQNLPLNQNLLFPSEFLCSGTQFFIPYIGTY